MPRSDHPALELLYREILAELRQYARKRLGDVADAEDVVQEAFVRFQRQENSGNFENPRAYLYTTVNHLVIDRVRERQRQAQAPEGSRDRYGGFSENIPQAQIDELTPERVAAQRQELSRMLEAVKALPPQAQRAFLLHKVRHLSYAEVAERMGLSKSTVEKHMIRALRLLNEALRSAADPGTDGGPEAESGRQDNG